MSVLSALSWPSSVSRSAARFRAFWRNKYVKLSGDLKIAKVYLSVLQKEKRDFVLSRVNLRSGQIRTDLAHNIRIKFVPELKFFIDDTLDYVEKIEGLINEIHKQNNNKPDK